MPGNGEKVGKGDTAVIAAPEHNPRSLVRANNHLIVVKGEQRLTVDPERHYPPFGKQLAEQASLDAAGGVFHDERQQGYGPPVAFLITDRYVDAASHPPLRIVNGRHRATERRIARVKMLIAVNRKGAILGQTGSYAVGALMRFVPQHRRRQTPSRKRVLVSDVTTFFERDAVWVRQEHAVSGPSNSEGESVEDRRASQQQRGVSLSNLIELAPRKLVGRPLGIGLKPVVPQGAHPGRQKSGSA